jgi:hypothetical protein
MARGILCPEGTVVTSEGRIYTLPRYRNPFLGHDNPFRGRWQGESSIAGQQRTSLLGPVGDTVHFQQLDGS